MASKDKKPVRSTSGGRPAGGIRTLADLNRRSGPDSDSDDDNAPQEYYTGGEKSGMLVQDPSKRNDVDTIFSLARQQGAIERPLANLHPSSSTSFTGTGRSLSGAMVPPPSQPPESIMHNIVFWRDGFTVNDGPLRRLDDPANAPFLESITRSECPKELEPADKSTPVNVNLIRRDENCPEKRAVVFQGVARTLGGSTAPPATEQNTSSSTAPLTTAPASSAGFVLDESRPSTSIQLRLADGTRMVAHFNHHHTISDIRAFIDASRPSGSTTYQLHVGFPPKPLNDLNQTIEQAGLANSVVIQKL